MSLDEVFSDIGNNQGQVLSAKPQPWLFQVSQKLNLILFYYALFWRK